MPKRILMFDDEKECIEAVEMFLTGEGFEFIGVQNFEKFMEVVNEQKDHIDLIILDLEIPGMFDGADIFKKIKKGLLGEKIIPVLVYTYTFEDIDKWDILNQAKLYGARCVSKSDPSGLLKQIRNELSIQEAGDLLTLKERKEMRRVSVRLDEKTHGSRDRLRMDDPDWLRFNELYHLERGEKEKAEEYRKKREWLNK